MKIALVCPASLPATQFGGILFLAVDIARELSKLEHNVTIYTTDMDFANNPKTFNKHLPRSEKVENFFIKRTHVLWSYGLFFVNPKMYNQLKNDNPDIIHSIGIRSFQSLIAAIVSKNKKIPLILSDQGGLTTHPDLKKNGFLKKCLYKIQKPMINFIIKQSTKIIVANEYEKKIFSELNAEAKIVVVKNGINIEKLDHKNFLFKEKHKIEKRFILFLGRFDKVKGIDVLLKATKILKNKSKNLDFKIVIMGVDFGFERKMEELIDDFKLNDDVIVIKNPLREEVIAAYKECEFLTLPSRWELSPLTPLEGFAFKKPVISTDAHGIPYTITNNINGILIPNEDEKALSEAISEFLDNEEKREKFGIAGYEEVMENCNSKVMAKKTLDVYEKVLGIR